MVFSIVHSLFADNVKLLKSEASKTAYQGVVIALAAVIAATCLVCYVDTGSITVEGAWNAQKNNVALWILNFMPFAFGFWGQYSNSLIAYQAGAMIVDQTFDLRSKADDLEKQTAYVSTHDRLTDLPLRALFYDRAQRAILAFSDHDNKANSLSILLIEIENYKDIYDTLGRNRSDMILKQISTRLQSVSPHRDDVAKIDGNIFGVLVTDAHGMGIGETLAQHIQKTMEPPFHVDGLSVAVHTNVGIVHYPEHGEDVDTLVQRAGVAIHVAQRSSHGYATYDPSHDKHSPVRLTLVSELRNAIERDDLELFYQPKVTIRTAELTGAEALLRWKHPVHGYVPPDEFVALAERNRMIKMLTHWVLKRAFRDCSNWHNAGIPIKISINLSTKDLHDPELPDIVSGVAAAANIQPDWIIFEITESSVMAEPENALVIIKRLREMGYRFSIDDFGTGYSSLAYLKKLPLTELKIDKSFVMDILESENDAAIVKATIGLGQNLGLSVTAEGVENKEIMNRLMEYGCDIAQGYFLSKPLAVEDFNLWVKSSSWKIQE